MPRRNQSPQHAPFRFASNCQSKRRFDNEHQAQETAEHQMLLKPDLELSAYKCELCGGWHLTRRSQK